MFLGNIEIVQRNQVGDYIKFNTKKAYQKGKNLKLFS